MLEAHIKIDKDLAVKGFRRALKYKALQDISYFYAVRLMIVWLVVSLANALWEQADLSKIHLVFLVVLWIGISIHGYYKWHRELADQTEGWEFIAKLDDTGVTTQSVQKAEEEEIKYGWDRYQSYKDCGDYLQIAFDGGGYTFLPKTAELAEVIEFTKNKIPEA